MWVVVILTVFLCIQDVSAQAISWVKNTSIHQLEDEPCPCSRESKERVPYLRNFRRHVLAHNSIPPEDLLARLQNNCNDVGRHYHNHTHMIAMYNGKIDKPDCPDGVGALATVCLTMLTHNFWPMTDSDLRKMVKFWLMLAGAMERTHTIKCLPPQVMPLQKKTEFYYHHEEIKWNIKRLKPDLDKDTNVTKMPIPKYILWRNPSVTPNRLHAIEDECWSNGGIDDDMTFGICCRTDIAKTGQCWDGEFNFERCCATKLYEQLAQRYNFEYDVYDKLHAQLVSQGIVNRSQKCIGLDQGCLVGHCYANKYEEVQPREDVRAVLQIGICYGESLALWADWFPNAQIVGVDIVPERFWNFSYPMLKEKGMSHHRVQVIHADATLDGFGEYMLELFGPEYFDVIIDDGIHVYGPIVKSFQELFVMSLKPGGWYFVEDSHVAYDTDKLSYFHDYMMNIM